MEVAGLELSPWYLSLETPKDHVFPLILVALVVEFLKGETKYRVHLKPGRVGRQ